MAGQVRNLARFMAYILDMDPPAVQKQPIRTTYKACCFFKGGLLRFRKWVRVFKMFVLQLISQSVRTVNLLNVGKSGDPVVYGSVAYQAT